MMPKNLKCWNIIAKQPIANKVLNDNLEISYRIFKNQFYFWPLSTILFDKNLDFDKIVILGETIYYGCVSLMSRCEKQMESI